MDATAKPIVWAFCNGRYPWGDEAWVAMTNDGEIIAGHVSSNSSWGQHDVGPTGMHKTQYLQLLDTTEVDYRVVPEGEELPAHVLEANRRRHAAAETGGDQ